MTKYSMALVYWRDAHDDAVSAWTCLEDIENEPYLVTSVGILLPSETKQGHVSLARSSVNGMLDSVLHIPSGMVESIEILGAVECD